MRTILVLSLLGLLLASPLAKAVSDITPAQLLAQPDKYYVLDVRTRDEFVQGHVPGAKLLPYNEISAGHQKLPANHNQPIVLYCRSGRRAGIAAETLTELGFTNLYLLEGSMQGWRKQGLPVEDDGAQ